MCDVICSVQTLYNCIYFLCPISVIYREFQPHYDRIHTLDKLEKDFTSQFFFFTFSHQQKTIKLAINTQLK